MLKVKELAVARCSGPGIALRIRASSMLFRVHDQPWQPDALAQDDRVRLTFVRNRRLYEASSEKRGRAKFEGSVRGLSWNS